MNHLNTLLFGYYPYVALTVFLLGSLARFERDQFSWRSGSSQMLRSKDMRLGSNLFHMGILMLFVGHTVGLLTPPAVYHALGLSTSAKQVLAVVAGGLFGGICAVGLFLLIRRRWTDPRIRATSSRMDFSSSADRRAAGPGPVDPARIPVSPGRQQYAAAGGLGAAHRHLPRRCGGCHP